MAEQVAHHVVNDTRSMGDAPVDAPGYTHSSNLFGEGLRSQGVEGQVDPTTSHISSQPASAPTFASNDGSRASDVSRETTDPSASQRPAETAFPQIRDEPPAETLVNGDGASHAGTDDRSDQISSTADAVISDSELSRGEGFDQQKDLIRHERSNSIKKPTAFKSVSVTKNFLAKSVTGSTTTTKLAGEKASPAGQMASLAQQPARPRLVAKSGRDNRSTVIPSSASPAGPDASKVWNRNQPVPPPPPKQFTDEELKQQYGIHLATRLQADEPGKGSKWADMEDDEDDWAPDTVEWMDGTKSTLQSSDNQQQAEQEAQSAKQREQEQLSRAGADPSQRSTLLGPGRTILKPGARTTNVQPKPGLILRSVPENAQSPEKPASPAASKSPWAQLPPVDKASPITFVPPSQPPPGFPEREPSGPEPNVTSPSPAREIAADTFDRSWREHDRGSRELFDSRSGRYEPVRAGRRSSFKQEPGFRPPSVLQRPLQSDGSEPPAAALAHSRMSGSQDARNWGRRGSSANVEDRGFQDRRMSTDHSTTSNDARAADNRQSPLSAKTAASVTSSQEPQPPNTNNNNEPRRYAAHAPHAPQGPAPSTTENQPDHVALQQQLMKQSIEANRRRKQEEAAKEEAAKQERIRQKLQALGDLPPKRDASSPSKMSGDDSKHASATQPSPSKANITDLNSPSPNKSPAAASKAGNSRTAASEQPLIGRTGPARPLVHDTSSTSHAAVEQTSSQIPQKSQQSPSEIRKGDAGVAEFLHEDRETPDPMPTPTLERQNQNWTSANHPPASWGPVNNNNVWGPPSNDKTLGNGAFDGGMQRLPSLGYASGPSLQRPLPGPGPIGPPTTSSPQVGGQPARSNINVSPIGGPHRPDMNAGGIAPFDTQSSQRHHFSRVPPIYQSHSPFGQQQPDYATGRQAWKHFASTLEESERREREEEELAHRDAPDLAARVGQPVYEETFRKISTGDRLGERNLVSKTQQVIGNDRPAHAVHGHPSSAIESVAHPHYIGGHGQTHLGAQQNGRASRFFDLNAYRRGPVTTAASSLPAGREASRTPPPDAGAALFANDSASPVKSMVVRLPGQNEDAMNDNRPKVKLPPRQPEVMSPNMDTFAMPGRSQFVRLGPQPLVNQPAWQDRFDGLFDRKRSSILSPAKASPSTSPPTRNLHVQPLDIASSSRAPFDVHALQSPTMVSLPHNFIAQVNTALFTLPRQLPETKPSDGCLYDEPENGSRPAVVVPRASYVGLWDSEDLEGRRKTMQHQQAPAALVVTRIDAEFDGKFDSGYQIRVRMDDREAKVKLMPRRSGTSSPRNKRTYGEYKKKGPVPAKASRAQVAAGSNGVKSAYEKRRGSTGKQSTDGDKTGQTPGEQTESGHSRKPKAKWAKPLKGPRMNKQANASNA